ncbi:MAG: ATP-binding cassette domain-containing protein [Eubacteriales bacterium]
METVLEIKNLSKSFGSRRVLSNVTLDVHEGEILGYLGPNGSGKTTTIKLILGLLQLTHGSISICSHDIVSDFEGAIACVGGIVENPEMYPYLSARDNLRHFARMYGDKIDEARIDEVLELVGLSERANEKISKYSLGMRQRLGVAQAIMHRPRLLVLDEPTNGLDPAGIKDLRDLLKKLAREEGLAVFVSSHLLSELELLCDTVAVINHGKVVSQKAVSELKNVGSDGKSVLLIEADGADLALNLLKNKGISAERDSGVLKFEISHDDIPSIIYLLSLNGVKIYSVSEQKRSLEDAFLEITSDIRTDAKGGKTA